MKKTISSSPTQKEPCMIHSIKISWPNFLIAKQNPSIVPLFLPFMGCQNSARCIFCAQDLQTGENSEFELETILLQAADILKKRKENNLPKAELAFFGGTFTALPEKAWQRCLEFAVYNTQEGLVNGFRCSTRPDALGDQRLGELISAGCSCIELGVQSFSNKALAASCRGYSGGTARTACAKVKAAGLQLVVQLLPGMPGLGHDLFLHDVREAIDSGADMLRFYPCLVLAGTKLAELWQQGIYKPWNLDETISVLATAWRMAQLAMVPVIRIGLAPEKSLEKAVLSGPSHPALGARVMARALLDSVLAAMKSNDIIQLDSLYVPKACQGFFWGHGRELAPFWNKIGIQSARFVSHDYININYIQGNTYEKQ